ncbi:MAG: protein kinase [Planctomycetes bacterium]|nr:protein kinase [Planctomycetota bacterium]
MALSHQQLGPYKILNLIGRGGMGAVYHARHPSGVEVALKVLLAGGRANSAQRERFRRELSALQRLRHSNVLSVIDAGEAPDGSPWIAMPLVQGEDLKERLARAGPLPIDEVLDLAAQISDALAHVHSLGLVHRDVKPDNILCREQDGLSHWILTDFGLVKDLEVKESQALSRSGAIQGTPGYWAPEQAAARPTGSFTDVYGLGALLYAALTGTPPVSGVTFWEVVVATQQQAPRPLRELRPEVPKALESLIMRCLEKDSADRFADGAEVAEALEGLSAAAPGVRSGTLLGGLALLATLFVLGVAAFGELAAPARTPTLIRTPGASVESSAALSPAFAGAESRVVELRARALEGDREACFDLGRLLTAGVEVEQDLRAAERWLTRAAEGGHLDAHSVLASLLVQRRGPSFDRKKDQAAAYTIAARGGVAGAMLPLSGLHRRGLGGERDYTEARRWMLEAVRHGVPRASEQLKALEEEIAAARGDD